MDAVDSGPFAVRRGALVSAENVVKRASTIVGEGHTPSCRRLERLGEAGHAVAAVKLGRGFLARGMEQVGPSDDGSATAMEQADCLSAVSRALERSGLPGTAKLLIPIGAKPVGGHANRCRHDMRAPQHARSSTGFVSKHEIDVVS